MLATLGAMHRCTGKHGPHQHHLAAVLSVPLQGSLICHCLRRALQSSQPLSSTTVGKRSELSERASGTVRGLKPRRRRLLLTTKTLERAMAAPAIIGLSIPAAASGIAATL